MAKEKQLKKKRTAPKKVNKPLPKKTVKKGTAKKTKPAVRSAAKKRNAGIASQTKTAQPKKPKRRVSNSSAKIDNNKKKSKEVKTTMAKKANTPKSSNKPVKNAVKRISKSTMFKQIIMPAGAIIASVFAVRLFKKYIVPKLSFIPVNFQTLASAAAITAAVYFGRKYIFQPLVFMGAAAAIPVLEVLDKMNIGNIAAPASTPAVSGALIDRSSGRVLPVSPISSGSFLSTPQRMQRKYQ